MYLGKVHTGPARKVGEFFAFEDLLNIQSIELEGIPKSLALVLVSGFPNRLLMVAC